MANSAPMGVYQGSKGMRRKKVDRVQTAARKTVAGKGIRVKRVKSQTPVAGEDMGY